MAKAKANVVERYSNQFVTISNDLSRAKRKANLLEEKVELLAISRLKTDMRIKEKRDGAGNSYEVKYVVLRAGEIQDVMGRSDWGTYQEIRSSCIALKQKIIMLESKEDHQFLLRSLYEDIIYDRGTVTIEFSPSMEMYFMNLSANFSKYSLALCFRLSHEGSLQLYKSLKTEMYRLPSITPGATQDELPGLEISYSLADLRMCLGIVDLQQPQLQNEMNKKHPDFDKINNLEKKPKYARFCDLEKRLLIPGIEDINENTDIYVAEMRKNKAGQGGKITGVTFVIKWNAKYEAARGPVVAKPEKKLSESEKADFLDLVLDLVPEKIKVRDAQAIAKAVDYNEDRLKKAVDALLSSKHVDNPVGFIIEASKNGWERSVAGTKKNEFNNFSQNTYDYDELEKTLVAN